MNNLYVHKTEKLVVAVLTSIERGITEAIIFYAEEEDLIGKHARLDKENFEKEYVQLDWEEYFRWRDTRNLANSLHKNTTGYSNVPIGPYICDTTIPLGKEGKH